MLIRQAITTKFLPVTNIRGSRVKATAEAGSVILSWDSGSGIEDMHATAAKALAEKFGWRGAYYQGSLPGGGYVFVCVDGNYGRDTSPVFTIALEA